MEKTTMNICIGGEAGQGLATIGHVLGKLLVRKGYHLHVSQVYESRIRGGHNTFTLRVGSTPVAAPTETIDLLVALDAASLPLHEKDLAPGAVVLSDDSIAASSPRQICIPLKESGKSAYQNTALLGGLGVLLGFTQEEVFRTLAAHLAKLSPAVIKENEQVLEHVYAWLATRKIASARLAHPPFPPNTNLMLHGNEAIALGAVAAGLKLCCFYPMSPGTSVPLTVASVAERMGIVVEQVEDEIAAVNMAIGASYAGARPLVATSGGGFALMTEGISLAGVSETPVVVVIAMRPGPATGLATRTEQADLELALYAGHGEFPRAIFAPGGMEECFHLTKQAFAMAERYQGPAIVLTDQYLADSYRHAAPFELTPPPPLPVDLPDDPAYQRYEITESGVSPQRFPGMGKALVVLDSHEHTPAGHITEDLPLRVRMQDKRMRKLEGLRQEAIPPAFTGPEGADILLVCWGSAKGAVEEAAAILREQGRTAATCHFSQVYPLREETFVPRFKKAKQVVVVESNSTGQMAGLIRRETGFNAHGKVLRYDGLAMTASYITNRLAAHTI